MRHVHFRTPNPTPLAAHARLIRLDKPIGILLLLWPTLWGLWIAAGKPDAVILAVFVAGTALMRSAGCAINDWADRDFDRHVKRTALRPLAAGDIAPREALIVAAVLALIAFALVVLFSEPPHAVAFNSRSAARGFVTRSPNVFSPFPQAYLGIAFGFGIRWPCCANRRGARAGLVAAAGNTFWTLAYDTEYAMVDRDDDIKLGIKTSALLFGKF